MNFVMLIELTRAIVIPRLPNFLRNSTIHSRTFFYLVTSFLRVEVSLPCRQQAVSKIFVPIYPYLITEGDEIVPPCDRHSNETVTLRKHVAKYKHMRKWAKFLKQMRIVALKLLKLTRSASPKQSIYFKFVLCLGCSCDVDIFKLTARA